MGCSPGKDCCDDCRREAPRKIGSVQRIISSSSSSSEGVELSRQAQAVIDEAEGAVRSSGYCNSYGTAEDVFVSIFGDEQDVNSSTSSAECEAYKRQLATLRLWQGQLNDAIDRGDSARAETISADIVEVATQLGATSSVADLQSAFQTWASKVGETAGEIAADIVDAAGNVVSGASQRLGFWRIALIAAVAVVIINPSILAKVVK